MIALDPGTDRLVARLLARCMGVWGLPGLERTVTVAVDPRLRRSIARSSPRRWVISLNPRLNLERREELAEILCHEAAHLVAWLFHAGQGRPHGAEWAWLLTRAGYEPLTHSSVLGYEPSADSPRRRYRHVCPVCHSSYQARRVMHIWRCAECVENGLDGHLIVEEMLDKVE